MAGSFEAYEQEFLKVTQLLQRTINSIPNFAGERKKTAVREAEKDIEDAEQLIRQMDKEINMGSNPNRTKLTPKVKGYQTDVQRIKRDLQRSATSSSNNTRDELLSGATQDYQVQFLDQRSKLIAGNEKIEQTSGRLQNAHRLAIQNEQIGTAVLTDLQGQRDQLIRTGKKLDDVDDDVKTSRTILTGMARRVATNKLILAIIIVLLLGGIILIVYMKWLRPLPNNNNNSTSTR